MTKVPESPADLNKGAVEAMLGFAQVSMESAEQMLRLQLSAARTFAEEQAEAAKALGSAKDAKAVIALRARLANESVGRALGYSREVYEVATHTQRELSRLAGERFAVFQREMAAAMESMIKAAPGGGSDAAVQTAKSTMAAVQYAMDSMSRAAKEASDMAQANVQAVAQTATANLKKTRTRK